MKSTNNGGHKETVRFCLINDPCSSFTFFPQYPSTLKQLTVKLHLWHPKSSRPEGTKNADDTHTTQVDDTFSALAIFINLLEMLGGLIF